MLTPIQRPNSTGADLWGEGWIKRLATLPPFGEAKDFEYYGRNKANQSGQVSSLQ